jgi:hypothetical protein
MTKKEGPSSSDDEEKAVDEIESQYENKSQVGDEPKKNISENEPIEQNKPIDQNEQNDEYEEVDFKNKPLEEIKVISKLEETKEDPPEQADNSEPPSDSSETPIHPVTDITMEMPTKQMGIMSSNDTIEMKTRVVFD